MKIKIYSPFSNLMDSRMTCISMENPWTVHNFRSGKSHQILSAQFTAPLLQVTSVEGKKHLGLKWQKHGGTNCNKITKTKINLNCLDNKDRSSLNSSCSVQAKMKESLPHTASKFSPCAPHYPLISFEYFSRLLYFSKFSLTI